MRYILPLILKTKFSGPKGKSSVVSSRAKQKARSSSGFMIETWFHYWRPRILLVDVNLIIACGKCKCQKLVDADVHDGLVVFEMLIGKGDGHYGWVVLQILIGKADGHVCSWTCSVRGCSLLSSFLI